MSEADEIIKRLGGKSSVKWVRGAYRGLGDGLRALVDFDGGLVPAHIVTGYRPAVNEPVWVCITDDVAYLVGPTRPRPADGKVVSSAGGLVVVNTDVGQVSATYPFGATMSAGQEVKLFWGGELPHVIGVKSTSPVAPDNPGGGSGTSEFTTTFTAVDAGSYNSSWWTSQVWSSDNNLGAWFYGSKIPDTIPAGAVIIGIDIYLAVVSLFGSPMNIGVHPHRTRPGGAPSIGSTVALAPAAGWFGLPTSIGNALRSGGGSFGVGVAHGGFHKFAALSADPQSGALRIRYRI